MSVSSCYSFMYNSKPFDYVLVPSYCEDSSEGLFNPRKDEPLHAWADRVADALRMTDIQRKALHVVGFHAYCKCIDDVTDHLEKTDSYAEVRKKS